MRVGKLLFFVISYFDLNNAIEGGHAFYADNTSTNLDRVTFNNSKIDDVILKGFTAEIVSWKNVIFSNPQSNSSISCSGCEKYLCRASTNCSDCIMNEYCIQFGENTTTCTGHFGCNNKGLCHQVRHGRVMCTCLEGYVGDLCFDPPRRTRNPYWWFFPVLAGVGGIAVIGTMIYLGRMFYLKRRKSGYQNLK